jgi:hypothetical protein
MNHAGDINLFRSNPQVHVPGRTPGLLSWLTVLCLAMPLSVAQCLWAQASKPTDYDVKAVYLYNFSRFIEWPARVTTNSESFNVCVLGQDPFGPALDATLVNETISGKSVTAKRISTPEEAVNCQILYLSSTEESRLNKIIEGLNKGAVLTVSDMPQFSQRGGMIQFVLEGKKVRFEVNLSATQRAGLTLSSELLKVATTVRRNP